MTGTERQPSGIEIAAQIATRCVRIARPQHFWRWRGVRDAGSIPLATPAASLLGSRHGLGIDDVDTARSGVLLIL